MHLRLMMLPVPSLEVLYDCCIFIQYLLSKGDDYAAELRVGETVALSGCLFFVWGCSG